MPPVAQKIEHTHVYHDNIVLKDNFHWMKDQNSTKRPEIVDYLNLENAFCKAEHLDKNGKLAETIYNETLSKIKEDDDSVPVKRGDYIYYSRSVQGQSYSLYCRKQGDGEEEVLLDQNKMDHEYCSLGAYEVSSVIGTLRYIMIENRS
jgi:oligopeptidase B